jgi:hypothetical protein
LDVRKPAKNGKVDVPKDATKPLESTCKKVLVIDKKMPNETYAKLAN